MVRRVLAPTFTKRGIVGLLIAALAGAVLGIASAPEWLALVVGALLVIVILPWVMRLADRDRQP